MRLLLLLFLTSSTKQGFPSISCSLSPWEQGISSTSVHLVSTPGAAECQLRQGAPSPSSSPLTHRYDYKHHMCLSLPDGAQIAQIPALRLFLHGHEYPSSSEHTRYLGHHPAPAGQLWPPACRTVPRLPGQLIRKHCSCAASQIRDLCNSPVSNFLERNCSKPQSAGPKKVKPCDP